MPVSTLSPLITKLARHLELQICIRILVNNRNGAFRFIGGMKKMIQENLKSKSRNTFPLKSNSN